MGFTVGIGAAVGFTLGVGAAVGPGVTTAGGSVTCRVSVGFGVPTGFAAAVGDGLAGAALTVGAGDGVVSDFVPVQAESVRAAAQNSMGTAV